MGGASVGVGVVGPEGIEGAGMGEGKALVGVAGLSGRGSKRGEERR